MTKEDLSQLLKYNPETGVLTWVVDPARNVRAGETAGCKTSMGYIAITIRGVQFKAHRLAWILHYGSRPPKCIDHVNGRKDDNRISNLRTATTSQNAMNKALDPRNSTGVKGVRWEPRIGLYSAQLRKGGERIWLGYHRSANEAESVIRSARESAHGEYANHGTFEDSHP